MWCTALEKMTLDNINETKRTLFMRTSLTVLVVTTSVLHTPRALSTMQFLCYRVCRLYIVVQQAAVTVAQSRTHTRTPGRLKVGGAVDAQSSSVAHLICRTPTTLRIPTASWQAMVPINHFQLRYSNLQSTAINTNQLTSNYKIKKQHTQDEFEYHRHLTKFSQYLLQSDLEYFF